MNDGSQPFAFAKDETSSYMSNRHAAYNAVQTALTSVYCSNTS